MSIAIVIPNATFTKFVGQIALPEAGPEGYPITTALEGYHLTKTDGATTSNNQVSNKPDGSINGTPAYSANSATFANVNHLVTGLAAPTSTRTLIAVAQPVAAASSQIVIGNFLAGGTGNRGLSLFWYLGTLYASAERTGGGAAQAQIAPAPAADPTKWNFLAAVFNDKKIKLFRGAAGVLTASAEVSDNTIISNQTNARTLRVGGGGTAASEGFEGTCNVGAAVVHSAALADAQITQAYNFFKAKFDALGLAGL